MGNWLLVNMAYTAVVAQKRFTIVIRTAVTPLAELVSVIWWNLLLRIGPSPDFVNKALAQM